MRDEAVRHHLRAAGARTGTESGGLAALPTGEALDLLAGVPFGRIVFTQHALPAIRVVNHTLLDGEIVIRTHAGAALAHSLPGVDAPGVVVAYEADEIDTVAHTGWSVVVTGYARVLDQATLSASEAARYLAATPPWFQAEMTHLVVIHPEIVTGRRLLTSVR